jgi:hypothetical protein
MGSCNRSAVLARRSSQEPSQVWGAPASALWVGKRWCCHGFLRSCALGSGCALIPHSLSPLSVPCPNHDEKVDGWKARMDTDRQHDYPCHPQTGVVINSHIMCAVRKLPWPRSKFWGEGSPLLVVRARLLSAL